jgi:pimeloyl-ACP methyl ester carboxylesterase
MHNFTTRELEPMSPFPDVLWLNVSPAFQRFHRPLLQNLAQKKVVAQWDYVQSLDEPQSFDVALGLVHDYLRSLDRPVHLIGHGTSGLLALLYARQHPERLKSLTLLAVGVHPAVDWQAHYHAQASLLCCSRYMLLAQMAHNLWPSQSRSRMQDLVKVLEADLLTSLSPHTLFRRSSVPPGGVSVPLLVCGGGDDIVIDPNALQRWQHWMKPGDRLWVCPGAGYFFNYSHPEQTMEPIATFWASCDASQCSPAGAEAFLSQ